MLFRAINQERNLWLDSKEMFVPQKTEMSQSSLKLSGYLGWEIYVAQKTEMLQSKSKTYLGFQFLLTSPSSFVPPENLNIIRAAFHNFRWEISPMKVSCVT